MRMSTYHMHGFAVVRRADDRRVPVRRAARPRDRRGPRRAPALRPRRHRRGRGDADASWPRRPARSPYRSGGGGRGAGAARRRHRPGQPSRVARERRRPPALGARRRPRARRGGPGRLADGRGRRRHRLHGGRGRVATRARASVPGGARRLLRGAALAGRAPSTARPAGGRRRQLGRRARGRPRAPGARPRRGRASTPSCSIYPMLDDRDATVSMRGVVDERVWNRAVNARAWTAYLVRERLGGLAVRRAGPRRRPGRAADHLARDRGAGRLRRRGRRVRRAAAPGRRLRPSCTSTPAASTASTCSPRRPR